MTKEQNVGTARLSGFAPAIVTEEGYPSFVTLAEANSEIQPQRVFPILTARK